MTARELIERARDALRDMLSGWEYIRQTHGDLYGVGWDRAEAKAACSIAAIDAHLSEPQPAPLTTTFIQDVPDKCDRIVWRHQYLHLPTMAPVAQPDDRPELSDAAKRGISPQASWPFKTEAEKLADRKAQAEEVKALARRVAVDFRAAGFMPGPYEKLEVGRLMNTLDAAIDRLAAQPVQEPGRYTEGYNAAMAIMMDRLNAALAEASAAKSELLTSRLQEPAGDAGALREATWMGLMEGERNQAVNDLVEYGTGFIAPLYAVVEGIERKLMERNATPTAPVEQPAQADMRGEEQGVIPLRYDPITGRDRGHGA